jgi:CelD/BcsL family acetyltransferase involved in cellulose biosynthesis
MSDDPDRLPHDFAALVALHEARWGGAAGHAFAGPDGEFHRDFTATALANGWLRLWFLEVDGTPIAAKYNFRYGGVEWGYQAGRDPSWDRHGVGTLLFGHVLEDAFRAGVSEYRMLRGDEAYKQRFATSDPGSRVVVASRGPVGRLAAAALTTAAGSPRARRWLSRAGR